MMVKMEKRNPLLDVPKLDYNKIMNGSARDEILQAMKDYAFFYIVNIPKFDPHAEIDVMRRFFNQPREVKESYASVKHNPSNNNVLRGYGYTANQAGEAIEEVYNIGQYERRDVDIRDLSCRAEYISREPNLWPADNDFPGSEEFQSTLWNGFQIRIKLARKLVEELAAGLEFSEFVDKFKEAEFTSFYLKKYTAREASDNVKIYKADSGYTMKAEDGRDLSIPSHVDTTITLLATYSNGGLQAYYQGLWHDVPSVMGSLMMMSGELIEELSDRKIPSLRHRVIDIKTDRYSTPFFFNPSFHANISTSLSGLPTKTGTQYRTFGPWQVTQLHRDEPLLLNPNSLN
uniref:Putative isopenicillin-n-synthase n=1 Tax=Thalassocalyce inconstans TaxID=140487 RepID=A0A0A0RVW1_THAIN|nr:putative isopenicillin-n-synthase [Thalassocalyce inconstans]